MAKGGYITYGIKKVGKKYVGQLRFPNGKVYTVTRPTTYKNAAYLARKKAYEVK